MWRLVWKPDRKKKIRPLRAAVPSKKLPIFLCLGSVIVIKTVLFLLTLYLIFLESFSCTSVRGLGSIRNPIPEDNIYTCSKTSGLKYMTPVPMGYPGFDSQTWILQTGEVPANSATHIMQFWQMIEMLMTSIISYLLGRPTGSLLWCKAMIIVFDFMHDNASLRLVSSYVV